jgi:hypothetical protein
MNGMTYPSGFTVFKYNNFGNPVFRQSFRRLYTGSLYLQNNEYYYYEQFDPAAVKPEPEKRGDIAVYPNPTKGLITISYAESRTGETLAVEITNLKGQLVQRAFLAMQGKSHELMLGAEAPSGVYLLVIRDGDGAVLCRKKIIKD